MVNFVPLLLSMSIVPASWFSAIVLTNLSPSDLSFSNGNIFGLASSFNYEKNNVAYLDWIKKYKSQY